MKIWDDMIERRNRRKAEAADLEQKRVEAADLLRGYVEQSDKIPIPTEQCNVTLNLLGRALHDFGVALRAPTPAPLKTNLPLYRDFLSRLQAILGTQQLAAPDLAPMILARFSLISSAVDVMEPGTSIPGAVPPSPEQIAVWANLAAIPDSWHIATQDKAIEKLEANLKAANAALNKEVKVWLREHGFQSLEHLMRKAQTEEIGRAETFKAMCEAIEETLPTTRIPYDSWYGSSAVCPVSQRTHGEAIARLMTVCLINWVENELLAPRHHDAAHRLRQRNQGLVKREAARVKKKSAYASTIEAARAGDWDYLRSELSQTVRQAAETMERTMATAGEMEGLGFTSLHAAAKMGDENTMALVLIINKDVDAKNSGGLTPLHMAAFFGHKEAASLLVSAGATIDATESKGLTPLHCAAVQGQKQMVAFLIDNGADVNYLASGLTPHDLAKKHPEVCTLLRERGGR